MSATSTPAAVVAQLLAIDPHGLGGVVLRGPSGPKRDAWLSLFRELVSPVPWRRVPAGVDENRLVGGLDLAGTLAAGRPVVATGLMVEADGGVLVVPMAERLDRTVAAHLAAALDTGEVVLEREGLSRRAAARFALVLLDEGQGEEKAAPTLAEHLAFHLELDGSAMDGPHLATAEIEAARRRARRLTVPVDVVEALCAAGVAFGVPSLRTATLAVRVARAAAALRGGESVAREDAELAAALVLAPRATRLPAPPEAGNQAETNQAETNQAETNHADHPPPSGAEAAPEADSASPPGRSDAEPLCDTVAEATRAAIPPDLLAALARVAGSPSRVQTGGQGGPLQSATRRGRPVGTRHGAPGGGRRLALVDTLRAAAPWQPLRCRDAAPTTGRVLVRREDFRIARCKQRSEAVTIVCVDASGSAALHRLAEAKGAVELILADCYVRRDQVALIAFRGTEAVVVLPPTRSLTRAKRALSGQAGGGGTPLAAGLQAAALLAEGVRRKGMTPLVVMMTDGKANIDRGGRPGRVAAASDADAAASVLRGAGTASLVLDIAPRPAAEARRLAVAMGAAYIALPYADAGAVSRAAQAARPSI